MPVTSFGTVLQEQWCLHPRVFFAVCVALVSACVSDPRVRLDPRALQQMCVKSRSCAHTSEPIDAILYGKSTGASVCPPWSRKETKIRAHELAQDRTVSVPSGGEDATRTTRKVERTAWRNWEAKTDLTLMKNALFLWKSSDKVCQWGRQPDEHRRDE